MLGGEWWPDHVFCAWLEVRGGGGEGREVQTSVPVGYSEARLTIVFSVSAFCFSLL